MLKSRNLQEFGKKTIQAVDNRVRIITAGLGIDELQRVLRGDPPNERPNPRYKVHTTSFLFHIRPRSTRREARYYRTPSGWASL